MARSEAAIGSPTIDLRPGVAFPDWSAASAPAARKALDAILDVKGLGGYTELDAREDRVWTTTLRLWRSGGHAPTASDIAGESGLAAADVETVLAALAGRDRLVLDPASGDVVGAYPFSERDTGHKVRFDDRTLTARTLNAMCAIDALGAGAMYGSDIAVASACRECEQPVHIETRDSGRVLAGVDPTNTVVWAGIHHDGCSATSLCTTILFFCSVTHLEAWRGRHHGPEGVRLSVDEAMQVGKALFGPVLADGPGPGEQGEGR